MTTSNEERKGKERNERVTYKSPRILAALGTGFMTGLVLTLFALHVKPVAVVVAPALRQSDSASCSVAAFSPAPLSVVAAPCVVRHCHSGIVGAEYAISPMFRLSASSERNWAASEVSPIVTAHHGAWNSVLDAGPYDGVDVTRPAYQAGYNVFVFELSPQNQVSTVNTLIGAGLVEGTDFTIIRPTPPFQPPPRAAKEPHVYIFFAGVSEVSRPIALRYNPIMNGAGEGLEVAPDGTCTEERVAAGLCWFSNVVAIDEVLPEWATLWLMKLDVQGHEPQTLVGAKRTLASGRVNTLQMEWWPSGIIGQGTADGGVGALTELYDLGARCFDMGHTVGNNMPGIGIDRPSGLRAWTDAFLAVPRVAGAGDPIGAWDDLICQMPTLPASNSWLSPKDIEFRNGGGRMVPAATT